MAEISVETHGNTTEERGTVSVMVVDDHPIWRNAVGRDLEEAGFTVVAEADGVASAARRAAVVRPDVVLMDMAMPDGTGTEATRAVLEVSPDSRVLVLSASSERDDVLGAIKAGASGYLVKSASVHELVDAVLATARGQAVFTPGLAGLVLGEYRRMSNDLADRRLPPTLTAERPKCCVSSRKGCRRNRSQRD